MAADWAVVPFAVPIDVMVHEYRMTKKPKEMLEILADQNETKAVRIAWILRRCGLDVDTRKLPRMRNDISFDYDAFWSESADAAVCDRIREQMGRMNEVEDMESELTKELVRKDVPLKKTYEPPEIKEVKPGDMVEIPEREPADHGIYRIIGELWSIYLDKLRERGVFMLGSVEVLKMQDLERVVHELVEGM